MRALAAKPAYSAQQNSFKADLHIHTHFSDGRLSISQIVDLYGERGYGAIAITDHLCERKGIIGRVSHSLRFTLCKDTFYDYIETIKTEAERAWQQYNMLVLPGFEITKNSFINRRSAHVLVLGVEEFIDPDLPIEEILAQAKSMGGLTIAAHPFDTGDFEFQTFYLWSRREKLRGLIDAWEINYRKNIIDVVKKSDLPQIACSDFHKLDHFSSWKTKISSDLNQQDIFHAIREQKIEFFLEQL